MQVKIPVHVVPRAFVDYDMEQMQLLRQDLILSDGFRIPPLTPARLIALELVVSKFYLHPDACDLLDAAAAVVLVSCQQRLVDELTRRDASGEFSALQGAADAWFEAHGDALVSDYARIVAWILVVPRYGFDMRPGSGPSVQRECWYGGEFVGGVVAPAAKLLATPVEMVLWDAPLCLIGHVIAQQDAALGVKGVERPPDKDALRALMKEAAAREAAGKLHPWQFADPVSYDLTAEQFRANPNLKPFFQTLRAAFERNGRRPLDPADYPLPDPPHPSASSADPVDVFGPVLSVGPCADGSGNTITVEAQQHV